MLLYGLPEAVDVPLPSSAWNDSVGPGVEKVT